MDQLPILAPGNPHNRRYLETKLVKMGHLLDLNGDGKIDGVETVSEQPTT